MHRRTICSGAVTLSVARLGFGCRSLVNGVCCGLVVLGVAACNAFAYPETDDCTANQGLALSRQSTRERSVYLFVLDDSAALAAHAAEVKGALVHAVRRAINPACPTGDVPEDPFLRCGGRKEGNHYVAFAIVRAGKPLADLDSQDSNEASESTFASLVTTPAVPDGIFEWDPETFEDLHDGPERLEELMNEVGRALEPVQFSSSVVPQPFEALYELLGNPESSQRVLHQRQRLLAGFIRGALLLGQDDQSGRLGALYPEARYVNFLTEDWLCPTDLELEPSRCLTPMRNPLFHPVWGYNVMSKLQAVGPVQFSEDCLVTPLPDSSVLAAEPERWTRVERIIDAATYGEVVSFPWCFEALALPDDPQFLFPIFSGTRPLSNSGGTCHRAPPRVEFLLDPVVPAGRAQCRVFELHRAANATECACEGKHRVARHVDELPSLAAARLEDDFDGTACACELFQLTGANLFSCQHQDTFASLLDEPAGWCIIDSERGFGGPELTEWCRGSNSRGVRLLGRDVPAPQSAVLTLCESEHCDEPVAAR